MRIDSTRQSERSWRAVETIVLWTLLGALVAWFVATNVSMAFGLGLSSADDGYFALVAKNVALGKGYGAPRSSTEIDPFSQEVSLGPVAILAGAAATHLFGTHDWLLGLMTALTFCLQMGVAGVLLSRKFGARPTLAASLMAWLGLVVLSAPGAWFFGAYLGETTAFGWLLLGATLLLWEGTAPLLAAGVCLALAVLTKDIALFGAVGIIAGWIGVHMASAGTGRTAKWLAVLVFAFALPIAVWQSVRLIGGGLPAFLSNWRIVAGRAMPESPGLGDRVRGFVAAFDDTYGPALLVAAFALASLASLALGSNRNQLLKFAVPLWCGVGGYFSYLVVLAPLWTRYFWIGVALACVAIAAPLLVCRPRFRVGTVTAALVGCFSLNLFVKAIEYPRWAARSDLPAERQAVLKILSERSSPVVAQSWQSFFDILYLEDDPREWFLARDLEQLGGRKFFAIVNRAFTFRDGPHANFDLIVSSFCTPSLEGRERYSVYLCERAFWDAFPDGFTAAERSRARPGAPRPSRSTSG